MTPIATTILEQLGGSKFLAMTGARQLVYDTRELAFKLPGFAKDGINYVKVVLNADDTYSVIFMKYRGLKVTNVKTVDMIYADMLRDVFKSVTGLDCTL